MRKSITFWSGVLLVTLSAFTQSETIPETAADTQQMLDNIRERTGVQGIAVSLIANDQAPLLFTSGFANIEQKTPITEHTQFRFGSVSKILVAMSVMKLVEQDRLTLDTPVRELAPEIQFDNPYEPDFPLTVQHLLNHSTGWDAMRFAEHRIPASNPVSVLQALEIHPANRHSRWPPGSRTAYNNTGPLLAAYIVEKLSGMSFESFVRTHFFLPLNMNNTDYFYTDNFRENAATLYLGKRPLAYEHLNNRPAGGLNSDMADMTTFLEFLLTQGKSSQQALLSTTSFHALQRPGGTLATAAGIELTYAHGLNLFHANGQVLFGHEGSVRGGSALMIYQPELKKGYVVAVNGTGPAVPQIHQFLARWLTQQVTTEVEIRPHRFSDLQQALSGYYRSISPPARLIAPFTVLTPWRLQVAEGSATIGPLVAGTPRQLGSAGERSFSQRQTGKTVLTPAIDPLAGAVVHYGPMTLKRISSFSAYAPIFVLLLWLLAIVIAIGLALIWLSRKCFGKFPSHTSIRLYSWPLISLLPLLVCISLVLYAKASPALTELVAQPSWLSVGLLVSSVLFFLSSVWSMVIWWQTPRQQLNILAYWHTSVLIALNAVVAFFLLFNGLIAVRLWA